jgi:hypothetical protein
MPLLIKSLPFPPTTRQSARLTVTLDYRADEVTPCERAPLTPCDQRRPITDGMTSSSSTTRGSRAPWKNSCGWLIRHVTAPFGVVLAAGLVLSACGSSRPTSTSSVGLPLQYASCMRSHGVPAFPDQGPGAEFSIPVGSGINPQSPAFQSAQSACSNLIPRAGAGPSEATEQQKLRMLAESLCMRKHGLPSFPDPTGTARLAFREALALGKPGTESAVAFGRPGAFIAFSQSVIDSPAFKQAAVTCGLPGTRK